MYWTKELQIDLATCLILGFIFFIVDVSSFDYKNKSVYPILLLHHILNIFAQFGFLARDKNVLLLYIITPLFVMLHWATNGNKCFLTEIVNRANGTHERFRDIWYLLGFKNLKHYNELHYGYLFVAWIIAILRYINLK